MTNIGKADLELRGEQIVDGTIIASNYYATIASTSRPSVSSYRVGKCDGMTE